MLRRARGAAAIFAAAVAQLAPNAGGASPLELFGPTPRAVGLAGAGAADAEGAASAFANPARLAWGRGEATVGASGTGVALDVHLARTVCADSAAACAARYGTTPTARHAPLLPRGGTGIQLGWAARHPRARQLGFGALLYLPAEGLVQLRGPPAAQPHFPRLEAQTRRLSLVAAAGYALHERVAVGVGVQVLASVASHVTGGLLPAAALVEPTDVAVALHPVARLVTGVAWRPRQDLQLGLGVRQALGLRSAITSALAAGDLIGADMRIAVDGLWTPWTFELGGSWRPAVAPALQVHAGLRLALWSAMPNPAPEVRIDVGGEGARGVGAGRWVDIGSPPRAAAIGARDTLSPAVAAEWSAPWRATRWTLRGGYALSPAALPRATGAHNRLDNDFHALGVGVELRGRGAVGAFVAGAGQLQVATRRAAHKAAGDSDPVGDLDHGGALWHVALQIGQRF